MALEILDFGFCGFGIWDSEDFGIRDLGLCGFGMLMIGIPSIRGFGNWE